MVRRLPVVTVVAYSTPSSDRNVVGFPCLAATDTFHGHHPTGTPGRLVYPVRAVFAGPGQAYSPSGRGLR
jgi:hypothetical protein